MSCLIVVILQTFIFMLKRISMMNNSTYNFINFLGDRSAITFWILNSSIKNQLRELMESGKVESIDVLDGNFQNT